MGIWAATMGRDRRLLLPQAITRHPLFQDTDVHVTSSDGERALIYPSQVWDSFCQRLAEIQVSTNAKDVLMQQFSRFGGSRRLHRGAVRMPKRLAEAARFQRDILLLGAHDHLIVWDMIELAKRGAPVLLEQPPPGTRWRVTFPAYIAAFSPPADRALLESFTSCTDEVAAHIAAYPESARGLRPHVFEQLVARVLERFGFSVELTARTRDGGVDIFAVQTNLAGIPTRYIVECKRWTRKPISVELVRALYGVKNSLSVDHAIFVTTSRFTRAVWKETERNAYRNLHLVDFELLAKWLNRYLSTILPVDNIDA